MSRNTVHDASTRARLLQAAGDLLNASFVSLLRLDGGTGLTEIATHGTASVPYDPDMVMLPMERMTPEIVENNGRRAVIPLNRNHCVLLDLPTTVSDPGREEKAVCQVAILLQDCASVGRESDSWRMSLPGRSDCQSYIDQLTTDQSGPKRRQTFTVIQIELDHLIALNTRHGWDVADNVIDTTIARVQSVLPKDVMLGYCGGSSILLVTPIATSIVGTRALLTMVSDAIEQPIPLELGEHVPSFSIGWALFPQDGSNSEELLQASGAALAEVKRNGGGHERRADAITTTQFTDASHLERDLLKALDHNALSLNWMPIIAPGTQTVVALEALLRWERPGFGSVSPELFIRCAEDIGLIERLDQWSLRNACHAAANWSHPLRVCVNISPLWLANQRLSTLVASTLEATGLAPDRLQIEFSEKRPFGPSDIAYQEFSRLRALGIHIALDDFGSGYSSLERLANFPVDQVKLDRAFLARLGDDRRVGDVLRYTLQMARALGVSCCAKGVETERQMAFLDSYGCEEVQGYLLGSPTPDYLRA